MGIPPGGLHQVSALCGMKWLRKSIYHIHPNIHPSTTIQDVFQALWNHSPLRPCYAGRSRQNHFWAKKIFVSDWAQNLIAFVMGASLPHRLPGYIYIYFYIYHLYGKNRLPPVLKFLILVTVCTRGL